MQPCTTRSLPLKSAFRVASRKLPKLIHMDIDGIVEGKKEPSPEIFGTQLMQMSKVFGEGSCTAPRAL